MSQEFGSTSGYIPDLNKTDAGNAPDAYGAAIAIGIVAKVIMVTVWDFAAMLKTSPNGADWGEEFEITPDTTVVIELSTKEFNIKNKTAGQTARYQVVSFY